MTTLFFTVCSLQQYPQAVAVGHSLQRHHPTANFAIGLADRPERLPTDAPQSFPVVGVETLAIPEFGQFVEKYTWLEVLHATRPFFARFFLDQNPAADGLVFLGPECWVTAPLTGLIGAMDPANLVLLPQRLHPPTDAHWPAERHFLNMGVYQGETWALRRGTESDQFLAWWAARLHEKGWLRLCEGYGLDALWLNLVPAFFEGVQCLKNPGYGVGYGNADERVLRRTADGWDANGDPLSLVDFAGLNSSTLTWEPHLTDRPLAASWRELAGEYRGKIPNSGPFAALRPAFGTDFLFNKTPLDRYRLTRPLRRLVDWLDTVPIHLR